MRTFALIASLALLVASAAHAQDGTEEENENGNESEDDDTPNGDGDESLRLDTVVIEAEDEDFTDAGGTVNVLDEDELEVFGHNDADSLLRPVPGVQVRTEDGFGLRPNIGIRGSTSDRSRELTLMEDGVLFGPAPYSAPAAYYFPLLARVVGVEVFKGPGAVPYGPSSIGGALNLRSRGVPEYSSGGVDASFGLHLSHRLHAHYGIATGWGGILVELIEVGSGGFKELDNDGDTGFQRGEARIVAEWRSETNNGGSHTLRLTTGYAGEISHETYLGLTDADFADDPYQRYVASSRDRMSWGRLQLRLDYELVASESFDLDVTLYRHDYDRTWRRFTGFEGASGSMYDVLTNPDDPANQLVVESLRGDSDTDGIILVTNARTYVSQGAQILATYHLITESLFWDIELGARVHQDQIERDHFTNRHETVEGVLEITDDPPVTVTDNTGSTTAIAVHLSNRIDVADFVFSPGVRYEHIEMELEDRFNGVTTPSTQDVVVPGMGVYYGITNYFGVLAGFHRGFTPVSPGQPDAVDPQRSMNYEAGVRYADPDFERRAELVGFYNDVSNLLGACSGSSGCDPADLDAQFNGGEADVAGVEALFEWLFFLPAGLDMPVTTSYTLTTATFGSDFLSTNPLWGSVESGDRLPYIPMHQLNLSTGLESFDWGFRIGGTYVAEMLEEAGADCDAVLCTDSQFYLEASAFYRPFETGRIYIRGNNLTNAQPIVSRRPFGARPAAPLTAFVGFELEL